jgi:hypothetical protein
MAEIKVKIVSPDCETCEVIEENISLLTSHKNSFVLKASFYSVGTPGADQTAVVVPTLAEQCKLKYVWQYIDGDCCIENLNAPQYNLVSTDCSYNPLEPHWVTFKEGVGMKNICVTGDKFVKRYYRVCVLENVADNCGVAVWEPYRIVSDNVPQLLWGNKNLNDVADYLVKANAYVQTIQSSVNTINIALQGDGFTIPAWNAGAAFTSITNAANNDLNDAFRNAAVAFDTVDAIFQGNVADNEVDSYSKLYKSLKMDTLKTAIDAVITLARDAGTNAIVDPGSISGGQLATIRTDWADALASYAAASAYRSTLINLMKTVDAALYNTTKLHDNLNYNQFVDEAKNYTAELCKYINTVIFALQQNPAKYTAAIFTPPQALIDARRYYNEIANITDAHTVLWAAIFGTNLTNAMDAILTLTITIGANNTATIAATGIIAVMLAAWNAKADPDDIFTAAEVTANIKLLVDAKNVLEVRLQQTCNAVAVELAKNVDSALSAAKIAVDCICDIKDSLYTILNKTDVTSVISVTDVKANTSLQGLFKKCCESIKKYTDIVGVLDTTGDLYKLTALSTAISAYINCVTDLTATTAPGDLYLNSTGTTGFLNDLLEEVTTTAVYTWDNPSTFVNVDTNKKALLSETQKVINALFNAIEAIYAVKCSNAPVAVVLETAKVSLDVSGSTVLSGTEYGVACAKLSCHVPSNLSVEYTLFNDKEVVARQSNPCFHICEAGIYSVVACLNYAKYCVIQDITESNKVTYTGKPSEPCLPPPCIQDEKCKLELCFVGTNIDLATGSVVIGMKYENIDISDIVQIYLNGEQVAVTLTAGGAANLVYFNEIAGTFTIPSGGTTNNNGKAGLYTVVLSKKSGVASCSDSITVVNSKDTVLDFGLRFNLPPVDNDGVVDYNNSWYQYPNWAGVAGDERAAFEKDFINNPDTTVFEPDNEKDMIVSYYCVEPQNLIKMIDDDKFNVTLVKAKVPATIEDNWAYYNGDATRIANNSFILLDGISLEDQNAADVAQSGWVLTKVKNVNGVNQTECLGSGNFKSAGANGLLRDGTTPSATGAGRIAKGAYINFSEMFQLNNPDVECCEEDLYDELFVLTVFSNDGCKSGQFPFMFKKPLSEVTVLSSNGCILDCNQSTVLSVASTTNGSGNFTYKWFANGDLIADQSSNTLRITYENSAPGTYTVEVTDKGYSTPDSSKKACKVSKLSNTVVIVKKFAVRIVDASSNESDLVNINKAINLKAEVIGINSSNCDIKYQWLLKDCNGVLVRELNGMAQCLSKTNKLYISNPSNLFLNKFIEVTASYSTTELVPINVSNASIQAALATASTTVLNTGLNVQCVKKHKLHSAKDSIQTTSEFGIQLNTRSLNLFVDREICVNPLVDPTGYNVEYSWEYMSVLDYNTEIQQNKKKWKRNVPVYVTKADSTDDTTKRVNGNVPANWIIQQFTDGSENCFDYDLEKAQPGIYKLFVSLYNPNIAATNQQPICVGLGTDIIVVTKTLEPAVVCISDTCTFVCSEDCDEQLQYTLRFGKNIPKDYQVSYKWQIADDFNSTSVALVAAAATAPNAAGGLNVTTTTAGGANGAGIAIAGGALDLTSAVVLTSTSAFPVINLNEELKEGYTIATAADGSREKCIFFDCSNNGTLIANITYQKTAAAPVSLLKKITIIPASGAMTLGDNATDVITVDAEAKVKQVIKVDIVANGLSGASIYKASGIDNNVTLDPSGTVLCADVCGIPTENEKLYIGKVNTATPAIAQVDYIPTTYKWQFKALSSNVDLTSELGWADLTLDTTFNCLTVCKPGYYRVLTSKFLSDHWLDYFQIDTNGTTGAGTIWFDEYLDKKQSNNTIKYYLKGSSIICVENNTVAPQNVAVRTTSRNVVSFNQFGSTVNNTSDIGKLKAYVTPEGQYSYQWFKNGHLIPNAMDSTIKPELNESVSGAYSVKVSNRKGEAVSSAYNINYKK